MSSCLDHVGTICGSAVGQVAVIARTNLELFNKAIEVCLDESSMTRIAFVGVRQRHWLLSFLCVLTVSVGIGNQWVWLGYDTRHLQAVFRKQTCGTIMPMLCVCACACVHVCVCACDRIAYLHEFNLFQDLLTKAILFLGLHHLLI